MYSSGYSLPSFVADFPFDSSKSGIINGNKQIVFKRPALSNFSTNFLFAIGDQPTSNTSISVHFAKFTAFANPFLSTSALPSSPPVKSAARSTLNTQMSFYQVGLMTAALGALVPFEIAVIVVVGSYVYIYHGIYFAVCIGLLVVAMMMYVYSAKKVEQ